MKNDLMKLVFCSTLCFLIFLPYAYQFTAPINRFLYYYNTTLIFALISTIMMPALLLFILGLLIERSNLKFKKKLGAAFLVFFALAISCNVGFASERLIVRFFSNQYKYLSQLISIILLICLTGTFLYYQEISKKICINLCKLLCCFFPVFLFNLFLFSTHEGNRGNLNHLKTNQKTLNKNVFIFVFDEWSYKRSFSNGNLVKELNNLSKIKDDFLIFHENYSTFSKTDHSLPAILFEKKQKWVFHNNKMAFPKVSSMTYAHKIKNIFSQAKKQNFSTAMLGFYLPYASMLNNDVDFINSISSYNRFGGSFKGLAFEHLRGAAGKTVGLFRKTEINILNEFLYNSHGLKRIQILDTLVNSIIKFEHSGIFAVIHYPLPHAPFIFNRSGTDSIAKYNISNSDVERYRGNLEYLDTKISNFVNLLKENGKYENSLLIFTSDHSWRNDPDFGSGHFETELGHGNDIKSTKQKFKSDKHLRHVPLFIKAPNLTPGNTNQVFTNYMIGKLVKQFLDNKKISLFDKKN
ncbi:sulfatase-like hydrolase/transferase [Candidatus Uabimicrobium sp. HlEnr_7]|uniref:sulfatase-like hydrolase/transferase n=1 Tax=Candidatus Uabimicrobium helgolandensis TaxID=3095367 RepID=UPI003557B319